LNHAELDRNRLYYAFPPEKHLLVVTEIAIQNNIPMLILGKVDQTCPLWCTKIIASGGKIGSFCNFFEIPFVCNNLRQRANSNYGIAATMEAIRLANRKNGFACKTGYVAKKSRY